MKTNGATPTETRHSMSAPSDSEDPDCGVHVVPGMELSAGSAITGDTWQLSATDLPYAWIAPPKDFVGSADFIAELRLSNDQIADRQTIHLQWMTPSSSTPAQRELDRNERMAVPPISSEIGHPKDREAIRMAPSKERTQPQVNPKEVKRLLKRGKADFKVARPDAGGRASPTDAYAGVARVALEDFGTGPSDRR